MACSALLNRLDSVPVSLLMVNRSARNRQERNCGSKNYLMQCCILKDFVVLYMKCPDRTEEGMCPRLQNRYSRIYRGRKRGQIRLAVRLDRN